MLPPPPAFVPPQDADVATADTPIRVELRSDKERSRSPHRRRGGDRWSDGGGCSGAGSSGDGGWSWSDDRGSGDRWSTSCKDGGWSWSDDRWSEDRWGDARWKDGGWSWFDDRKERNVWDDCLQMWAVDETARVSLYLLAQHSDAGKQAANSIVAKLIKKASRGEHVASPSACVSPCVGNARDVLSRPPTTPGAI